MSSKKLNTFKLTSWQFPTNNRRQDENQIPQPEIIGFLPIDSAP